MGVIWYWFAESLTFKQVSGSCLTDLSNKRQLINGNVQNEVGTREDVVAALQNNMIQVKDLAVA